MLRPTQTARAPRFYDAPEFHALADKRAARAAAKFENATIRARATAVERARTRAAWTLFKSGLPTARAIAAARDARAVWINLPV